MLSKVVCEENTKDFSFPKKRHFWENSGEYLTDKSCASSPLFAFISAFSASMNGTKYPTAFFITRADLITCNSKSKKIERLRSLNQFRKTIPKFFQVFRF